MTANKTLNTAIGIVNAAVGKNRIINGDMRIDQRNSGSAVTINSGSNATYVIDRWATQGTASAGVFTAQRSTTAPAGFTNSFLLTVTTADSSLAASDLYIFEQFIEGYNVADFNFGTANAVTSTLSFWVRSSVTGTFGGALSNSAFNRSYPFTYVISSANTWEFKTVTITGDTSGTWVTDNGIGLRVYFGLGAGSNYSGTAGAWTGSGLCTATGATNFMATNGATLYITGVQLEAGSVATPFERRFYGQELQFCQRYYATSYAYQYTYITSSGYAGICIPLPVTMRALPTITTLANNNSNLGANIYTYSGTTEAQRQVVIAYAGGITIGSATMSTSFKAEIEL